MPRLRWGWVGWDVVAFEQRARLGDAAWGGVGVRKRWIRQRLVTDSIGFLAVGVPLIQGSMVDDRLEGHGRCWALGKASWHAPRIPCGILYMSQRSVHWLLSHHLKLPGLQSMHFSMTVTTVENSHRTWLVAKLSQSSFNFKKLSHHKPF